MKILSKYRLPLQKNGKTTATGKPRRGLSIMVVDDYIKFMIFLAAIGLVYIWNSHRAERQVKIMESYRVEVKRLKSNYLLKESTLSAGTRLSKIQQIVDTVGLRTLHEPAYKIIKGAEVSQLTNETAQPNTQIQP
ncbi:MAG: FtsL-like putative cell division protein [Bacteroidia bacterium]|nr:FtsL-like putative cell division protein [Bacteroidia bacterium]